MSNLQQITPSPAPTGTPVYWPTPTPYPTSAATPATSFGISAETGYTLAENLVQGYQTASSYGIINWLDWILITTIVLGGIWSIVKHVQKL
jgi:hypothetical protein